MKGAPPPPKKAYWRQFGEDQKFIVNELGQLLVFEDQYQQGDFDCWCLFEGEIWPNNINNENVPQNWGFENTGPALDNAMKFEYGGETYVISDDSTTITPELEEYQP